MLPSLAACIALSTDIFVDRGDYTIHAEKIGTGTPMVAIPGGPGFSGKAVWGIGFACRSNIKTYLFDQLGTGQSQPKKPDENPAQWISLAQTIEDLEAIRKAEKLDKWIVCGQSWGVIVALVYAARHPEHVDQLLLTSIPGIGFEGIALSDNLDKAIPSSVNKEVLEIELDPKLSPTEKLGKQIMLITPYYFYDPNRGNHYATLAPPNLFAPNVFVALQRNILNTERYQGDLDKLPALKIRTTMIQGHQDPCGSATPFLLKEKYLPNSQIFLLTRTGHFGWIENFEFFFSKLYLGLGIKPPRYIEIVDPFDEDPDTISEKDARAKNGWPFNYTPPSSN